MLKASLILIIAFYCLPVSAQKVIQVYPKLKTAFNNVFLIQENTSIICRTKTHQQLIRGRLEKVEDSSIIVNNQRIALKELSMIGFLPKGRFMRRILGGIGIGYGSLFGLLDTRVPLAIQPTVKPVLISGLAVFAYTKRRFSLGYYWKIRIVDYPSMKS